MVAARARQRYTPAEYLALEQQAEGKHEYIDGYIVAMAGASPEHDQIAGDVYGELRAMLRGGPCNPFSSDVRVGNPATGRYTYPDVSVVCGEARFERSETSVYTLMNPTLIVEVLSPSTEGYDRGDKFADYRRIPSLQEYVLIAQDRPSVDHYLRQGDRWLLTPARDLDASVSLPTIGCTLPLREIYRRIRFPGESPATTEHEGQTGATLA